MPGLDLLIPFAVATALFAYFPGPALLYTAAQTLVRGRRAGFMAALGIHLGCYLHVIAAALGLSAVLHYVPTLYVALKLAGAAYLIWLGISMWRQEAAAGGPTSRRPRSTRRALFESMLVEILNPKVALFFLAFLPQFVDPERLSGRPAIPDSRHYRQSRFQLGRHRHRAARGQGRRLSERIRPGHAPSPSALAAASSSRLGGN